MPGTVVEFCRYVEAVLAGTVMPDTMPVWEDGTAATEAELREIAGLMLYEARQRWNRRREAESLPARRKAARLLRRFLAPQQREQLKRRGHFVVETPSGRFYRFHPRMGRAEEVTRHGTRFFVLTSFCLHPEEKLPPADVTLAQLLLLSTDEEAFRQEANATNRRDQLWNGDWLRRLRQAARERAMMEGGTA